MKIIYNVIFIFFAGCFVSGCSNVNKLLGPNYADPISYDVYIDKTTINDIVTTFGVGSKHEMFAGNGVLTTLYYNADNDSALSICVNKNKNIICTPCGVPVNFHAPYDGITFEFVGGILKDVRYSRAGNNPKRFIIQRSWVDHAIPKDAVGNFGTIRVDN